MTLLFSETVGTGVGSHLKRDKSSYHYKSWVYSPSPSPETLSSYTLVTAVFLLEMVASLGPPALSSQFTVECERVSLD